LQPEKQVKYTAQYKIQPHIHMADQLPSTTKAHALITPTTASLTLLGRGLATLKSREIAAVRTELDSRYRKARDLYNRITDYGEERRFNAQLLPKPEEITKQPLLQPFFNLLQQLVDVFKVFEQLAEQEYGKAYFPLATMYQGGQGVSQNNEKVEYYSRLAFEWCVANQTTDDPEIWGDLSVMYGNGHGTAQSEEQAVFWVRKAAEQGHGNAQCNLGWMYESGQGVEQDDAQAVFWYQKAAEQHIANAQWLLAGSYRNGYGVTQDFKQAAAWYLKAAQQNHALAQFFLAGMYAKGLGVAQDEAQAIAWYQKAAAQGNTNAQNNLTQLGINWQEA
jgi:hypothetical protein